MNDLEETSKKLYARFKFELDALIATHSQGDDGVFLTTALPKLHIRNIIISPLKNIAIAQLTPNLQIKLFLNFATDLQHCKQYDLAIECLQDISFLSKDIPNEVESMKFKVEALLNTVQANYAQFGEISATYITPMSVTKLLVLMKKMRYGIDDIFKLKIKQQEELAPQILNICKLMMDIGQPLVWYNCGKYIIETLMFAVLSMESVINLCTIKHAKFRIKMYVTIFYATLTQSSIDEAINILNHTKRQVQELREREELDPPIPEPNTIIMHQLDIDVAVMKYTLDFWRDPDSLDFSSLSTDKYYKIPNENQDVFCNLQYRSFADIALCECIRVHSLTTGNMNEAYRKRSIAIVKAVSKSLSGYNNPELSPTELQNFLFSVQSLFEVSALCLFEKIDVANISEITSKLLTISKVLVDSKTFHPMASNVELQSTKRNGKTRSIAVGPVLSIDIEQYGHNIQLLQQLSELIGSGIDSTNTPTIERIALLSDFLINLQQLLDNETVCVRQKSFIRNIAMCLWSKYCYPQVQSVLSESYNSNTSNINQSSNDKIKGQSLVTKQDNVLRIKNDITPALQIILKMFVKTDFDDSILTASIGLLCANLLWLHDNRVDAISILKTGLNYIDQQRGNRVDPLLHRPEDVRDIFALQRASFSARAEAKDWYHSEKRLGAHAFAGYGIFGQSSSAEAADQALAELHTEMVRCYFHYELVVSYDEKVVQIKAKRQAAAQAAFELADKKKPHFLNKPPPKTSTIEVDIGTKPMDKAVEKPIVIKVEGLAVVKLLKEFCCNNSYYRCILLIEMAKIEFIGQRCREVLESIPSNDMNDDGTVKIEQPKNSSSNILNTTIELLKEAYIAIEESEGRERLLNESYQEMIVLTDKQRKPPLVVARNNRYIYLCPVACRSQINSALRKLKKSSIGSPTFNTSSLHDFSTTNLLEVDVNDNEINGIYYRIFAKERGSGSEISFYNEDFGGCEKKVPLTDLQYTSTVVTSPGKNNALVSTVAALTLNNAIVRIGPLKQGELYVFGCAPYRSVDDKNFTNISPSTIPVTALNPLPTIMLWALLQQTATDLLTLHGNQEDTVGVSILHDKHFGHTDMKNILAMSSARRVCDRFFLPVGSRNHPPLTIGRGINTFLFPEPSISSIALRLSSPVLKTLFIQSLLNFERLNYQPDSHLVLESTRLLKDNTHRQLSMMHSLHRISSALSVACTLNNNTLTLHVVLLGFELASKLLEFEILHASEYVQNPLTAMVFAMQTIPMTDWTALEHQLYCQLFFMTAKLAVLNRNIGPILLLAKSFLSDDSVATLNRDGKDLPVEVWQGYMTLQSVLSNEIFAPKQIEPMLKQIDKLFPTIAPDAFQYPADPFENFLASGYFWRLPIGQRNKLVMGTVHQILSDLKPSGTSDTIANDNRLDRETLTNLVKYLKEMPNAISDFLSVILQMMKDLISSNVNVHTNLKELLQCLPICLDYLSNHLQMIHGNWDLKVFQTVKTIRVDMNSSEVANATTDVNAGKAVKAAKPSGKKDAPIESNVTNSLTTLTADHKMTVPERFKKFSEMESKLQLKISGEIIYLIGKNCYLSNMVQVGPHVSNVNHFPTSPNGFGPNRLLQPEGEMKPSVQFEISKIESQVKTNNETVEEVNDNNLFSVPFSLLEYVRHIGASMEMLTRSSETPVAVVYTAMTFWNTILKEWWDPVYFAQQMVGYTKWMESMIISIEGVLLSSSPNAISIDMFGIDSEAMTVNPTISLGVTAAANELPNILTSPTRLPIHPQLLKDHVLSTHELMLFLIKSLWLNDQFVAVVTLGTQAFLIIKEIDNDLSLSFGEVVFPLIVNSQVMIVNEFSVQLGEKKSAVETFVREYEEAQQRNRKKKVRIARLEKSDEEKEFEAKRDLLQDAVDEVQNLIEDAQYRLKIVQTEFNRLNEVEGSSKGYSLLIKTKRSTAIFVNQIKKSFGNDVDFRTILSSSFVGSEEVSSSARLNVEKKLTQVMDQWNKITDYFRRNKEIDLLMESLNQQGELFLLFGKLSEATSVWSDCIDGLFSTMDSCAYLNWPRICRNLAPEVVDATLSMRSITAITILGRLSKFCVPGDWDAKSGYARFASELCRIPFQESLGHPQTIVGFAAYNCLQLGSTWCLGIKDDVVSSKSLCDALEEILIIMQFEDQRLAALPVVVLLEHFCAIYLQNPVRWLEARFIRIRLLIESHLFAQAASMLAEISSSITSIHNQSYSEVIRKSFTIESSNLKSFETSPIGLLYHGYAPYMNHLPPEDTTYNQAAIQWIKKYPTDFKEFAKKFVILLPKPNLTAEEIAARAEKKKKALEAAALEAAASKKGKGGKEKAESVMVADGSALDDDEFPIEPMFKSFVIQKLSVICGAFLLEIQRLEVRMTASYQPKLEEYGLHGQEMVNRSMGYLYQELNQMNPSELLSDNVWMSLYGYCQLLNNKQLIHRRKFREARGNLSSFLLLLRSDMITIPSNSTEEEQANAAVLQSRDGNGLFNGNSFAVVTQLYFHTRYLLIDIAIHQARYDDALTMITSSATEASSLFLGYWLRKYLSQRANIHLKLGNLKAAEDDCHFVITHYETQSIECVDLIKSMCLKVSIQRERNLTESRSVMKAFHMESIAYLQTIQKICERLVEKSGGYPVDVNGIFSFDVENERIRSFETVTPWLYQLMTTHHNEQELTLNAKINKKKLEKMFQIHFNELSEEEKDSSSIEVDGLNGLRLAPMDGQEGIYASSPFINIYLEEVRCYLMGLTTLCCFLQDCLDSGSYRDQYPSILARQQDDDETGDNYEKNDDHDTVYPTKTVNLDKDGLLSMMIVSAESALKLLRQVVYPPLEARLQLLLISGKGRLAKSSQFIGYSNDGILSAAELYQQELAGRKAVPPLELLTRPYFTALEFITNLQSTKWLPPTCWSIIKRICVELVESYGNKTDSMLSEMTREDYSARMKMAVCFLKIGISFHRQFRSLTASTLHLSNEIDQKSSTTAPLSDTLITTLMNITSSSATSPSDSLQSASLDSNGGGKGSGIKKSAPPAAKGDKKGASTSSSVTDGVMTPSLGTRDVLQLETSLLRELNCLWLDGKEYALVSDLHSFMGYQYPVYAEHFTIDPKLLPKIKSESKFYDLVVLKSSISTLWNPVQSPEGYLEEIKHEKTLLVEDNAPLKVPREGFFSHVAVFFILGDLVAKESTASVPVSGTVPPGKKSTAPVAATNASTEVKNSVSPVLTKLVLRRGDVQYMERKLRYLKDEYENAELKKEPSARRSALSWLQCHELLGELLCLMVGWLQSGKIDMDMIQMDWVENNPLSMMHIVKDNQSRLVNGGIAMGPKKGNGSIRFQLEPANGSDGSSPVKYGLNIVMEDVKKTIAIPLVSLKFIEQLVSIFTVDIAVDSALDNDLCMILRYALGHFKQSN